jgi:hypothetical protein
MVPVPTAQPSTTPFGVAHMPRRADFAPVHRELQTAVVPPFVGDAQGLGLRAVGRFRGAVGTPMRSGVEACDRVVPGADATSPGFSPTHRLIVPFEQEATSRPSAAADAPRRALVRRRGNKGRTGRAEAGHTLVVVFPDVALRTVFTCLRHGRNRRRCVEAVVGLDLRATEWREPLCHYDPHGKNRDCEADG